MSFVKDPLDFDVIDEFIKEATEEQIEARLDPQTGILYDENGQEVMIDDIEFEDDSQTLETETKRIEIEPTTPLRPSLPTPPSSVEICQDEVNSCSEKVVQRDEFLVFYNVDKLNIGQSLTVDTDCFQSMESDTVVILTHSGQFIMCKVSHDDLVAVINQQNIIIQCITPKDFYQRFQFIIG